MSDAQFGISMSLKQWKNRTNCNKFGVVPLDAVRRMDEWLQKTHNVDTYEKTNMTEKDIVSLLEKGKLPFIYLPMNYMQNDGKELCVDSEGTNWSHPVIPVGFDNETVYIYDCVLKGYTKELPIDKIKIKLPLSKFLKVWDLEQRRIFWFEKKSKKDKDLQEFLK